HDLVAPAHGDAIDYLGAVADQPRGEIVGLLRLGGAGGAAGKHDAVADAFDVDVGVRHGLLERGAHAVEIARDGNVEAGDLLAGGVEEENVGLPDRHADHVDAARGTDHRVGDFRVGDQHVFDVGRQDR